MSDLDRRDAAMFGSHMYHTVQEVIVKRSITSRASLHEKHASVCGLRHRTVVWLTDPVFDEIVVISKSLLAHSARRITHVHVLTVNNRTDCIAAVHITMLVLVVCPAREDVVKNAAAVWTGYHQRCTVVLLRVCDCKYSLDSLQLGTGLDRVATDRRRRGVLAGRGVSQSGQVTCHLCVGLRRHSTVVALVDA